MAKHLQFLRNATISTSRSTAKTALSAKLATLLDGEVAINRYQDGNSVKVLLGFNNTVGADGSTKQFIFDSDAIPADVQTALDAITGDTGSIEKIKASIIGKNTDGKDAETVYGAKAYAKDYADTLVNGLDVADNISAGLFVTKVSEENGKISVSKAAIASSDKTVTIKANETTGALDLAANIDGNTIVKSSDGVLSVASSALAQYVGSNAIKVSAADVSNNKTISLAINANDKVLSQDTNGLLTTLAISFDSASRKVQLKGKNSALVSEFDATAFVKDGILNDAKAFLANGTSQAVTFAGGSHTFTGLTNGNHYIGFEFATKGGEKTEYTYDVLDATDIIDVYVAGNGLALADHSFSVKKADDSETFLSVDANGVKVSGVQNAINTAAAKATTVVQKATSDAHINVTSSTASDGHMVYTVASVDTASASGLTTEISRAKSAEDTIEASVGLAADGSHIKTSGNYTSAATTIAGEIAALDTQVKALSDAKVSVAASTDTESAKYLEVSANDTDTVYTVKAKGIDAAIKVETDRATTAEAVIDAYVGKSDIPEGKTVMGVIVENEETTANSIKSLATTSGLLGSDDEIAYTAPTTSGEFSTTTSIMDMLNHIDSVWNTIDCGSY